MVSERFPNWTPHNAPPYSVRRNAISPLSSRQGWFLGHFLFLLTGGQRLRLHPQIHLRVHVGCDYRHMTQPRPGPPERQKQPATGGLWPNFFEVAQDGIAHRATERVGSCPAGLGANDDEQFPFPVEAVEQESPDFPGAETVDCQQQHRAVADVGRPVPRRGSEHPPHIFPSWADRQRHLGEGARALDRRRQAPAAPAFQLGVAEKSAEFLGNKSGSRRVTDRRDLTGGGTGRRSAQW